MSRSRSAVANAVRLLSLPQEVQWLVEQGSLSAGHGRALLSLPDAETQIALAEEIRRKGLSVRETEERVRQLRPQEPPERKRKETPPQTAFYRDAARQLGERLGRRVTIVPGKKRGKLTLEYRDPEDLNRLLTALEALRSGEEENR